MLPRILSYNVRHCRGSDRVVSPSRIAEVIAGCRADIVALQEVDAGRLRSSGVDQALAIADELKMRAYFHPALKVMEELYGDAILTALPSSLVKAGPLPGGGLRLEPRGALWAAIEVEGTQLQVLNTHLGLVPQERAAQTSALIGAEWIGDPACRDPVILVGDLNALPWGRSYRRLAKALAGGARMATRPSTPATFPSRFPTLALDHVLASISVRIEAVSVGNTPLARVASDHLPLIVDFSLGGIESDASVPDRR